MTDYIRYTIYMYIFGVVIYSALGCRKKDSPMATIVILDVDEVRKVMMIIAECVQIVSEPCLDTVTLTEAVVVQTITLFVAF